MENFNPKTDKIAVVLKEFTLKKKSDPFYRKYSEPYIVSMAIDAEGANSPAIDFNVLSFPNVRKGDTIKFDGRGHLIYGPKNPGSFLAYTALFMENDKDIRDTGEMVEKIVKSEAVNLGIKAILAAQPTWATAMTILQKLSELVSIQLQKNKDDELYRRNGTLLRDVTPPYDILRTYIGENDFIKAHVGIIPLKESNKLGCPIKKVNL